MYPASPFRRKPSRGPAPPDPRASRSACSSPTARAARRQRRAASCSTPIPPAAGRASRPRRPRQPGVEGGAQRPRIAGRLPGPAGLHLAGLVSEQGRARQGRCRPGTTSSCRGAARCASSTTRVAARLRHPADRGARGRPHGRRGRPRRTGLGGQRCTGRLCRDDAEGDRRRRDSAELAGRQVEGEPEPSARRPRRRRRGPGATGPAAKRRRWPQAVRDAGNTA